ncbi:uncharacterized protein BXZ73DRAFT_58894 [Epithele typhae]|uniref:uncharacterized protein n=1 Tax=Epithele typhae TaxID=378194 RepID=UPI002008CF96|nr:uncharacterized protein BXZ73DRAFT_58894 [Epithele typhae]KAH9910251.1 hypothetical protein BXZ73DRAFT_58894 [Epithele typhae]
MLITQPLVISIPMLKIPLLISSAISFYGSMTHPRTNAPPGPASSVDVARMDFLTRTMDAQVPLITMYKYIVCGLALAEAGLLAAHLVPPNPVSDAIIALLGTGSAPSSLRPSSTSVLGLVCTTLGGQIRIWGQRALGKHFTWKVGVQDDHELITGGPYSVVRHPGYAGGLLMLAGTLAYVFDPASYFVVSKWAQMTVGRGTGTCVAIWVLQFAMLVLQRVGEEDRMLSERFGEQWSGYAARVPYRLVPFVY